ncbi:hypothetical protein AVEN_171198-1 [Araneus ventricosus]|uniref:Mos1 transposase HTH domain-containing protein n=1 Tax=Araneus ventricosus TaxID=182803 RepID=A0A4Y2JBU3_ARAVE|nr:hypothetical protein AVEN_171198-1 [Araneus ventricosus]
MRAVIRFSWAKRCNCTAMYRQLHEVRGENAVSGQAMAKWCNMFEDGRADIDDGEREGRTSTATNSENAARLNESILANRREAADEIANKLDISHRSVHKITVKHLEFNKVCALVHLERNILVIGRWTEILRRGHRKTYAAPR